MLTAVGGRGVCSRSLAGFAGSNPAWDMGFSIECCVLSGHSSPAEIAGSNPTRSMDVCLL